MNKVKLVRGLMVGGLILSGAIVCMWMIVELGYRAISNELDRREAGTKQAKQLALDIMGRK